MFVPIIGFKDGFLHLFGREIYGDDRHLGKRSLAWSAPKHASGFFELPVAEGHNDVGKLQSFALVDGEEADAVGNIALDGAIFKIGVPLEEHGIEIGCVVGEESVQTVVKRTDISGLLLKSVETEEAIDVLDDEVDGQRE